MPASPSSAHPDRPADLLRGAVEPVVVAHGARLYDLEVVGNGREKVVRCLVDREGGIDIETIEQVTRALDGVVDDLVDGAFLLEVSSPGLERPLRRAEHFRGALGALVSAKYRDDAGRSVRLRAVLVGIDDASAVVTFRDDSRADADDSLTEVPLAAITSAHTVFEWGASAPPAKKQSGSRSRSGASGRPTRSTKEHRA